MNLSLLRTQLLQKLHQHTLPQEAFLQLVRKAYFHPSLLSGLQLPSLWKHKEIKLQGVVQVQGLVIQKLGHRFLKICDIQQQQSYSKQDIGKVDFYCKGQMPGVMSDQQVLVIIEDIYSRNSENKGPAILYGKGEIGQLIRCRAQIYFIQEEIQDQFDDEFSFKLDVPRLNYICPLPKLQTVLQSTDIGNKLIQRLIQCAGKRGGILLFSCLLLPSKRLFLSLNRSWSLPAEVHPRRILINNIDEFLFYKPFGAVPKIAAIKEPVFIQLDLTYLGQGKLTQIQTLNLLGLKKIIETGVMEIPWNSGNGSSDIQVSFGGYSIKGFFDQQKVRKVQLNDKGQVSELWLPQIRSLISWSIQNKDNLKFDAQAMDFIKKLDHKGKSEVVQSRVLCSMALSLGRGSLTVETKDVRKAIQLLE